MLNTLSIILISSFLSWNWGETSPQFQLINHSLQSGKYTAGISLVPKYDNMLEVNADFYNSTNKEINVDYKFMVTKSGQSKSSSNQSGNLTVNSKEQVVLSKITVNLNKEDFYKITLQVFSNNQLIADDNASFYGDKIILK